MKCLISVLVILVVHKLNFIEFVHLLLCTPLTAVDCFFSRVFS